jgi:LysR family nitrogen assimilation transcriptional regulator
MDQSAGAIMDIRQLEYFLAICEQKSFSRAVDALDISQPSLSRHMQQLEAELGLHLFHRTGRGVEPTQAGLRLLTHAQKILRAMRDAREDMLGLRDHQVLGIRLGLPPRISRRIAPALVTRFRETFEGATLNVKEGLSVEMFDWLIKGRIDIALLYDPPPSDRISCRTVSREELVLAYSSTYAPAPPPVVQGTELGDFPLVLPSPPYSIRKLVDRACQELGISLNIVAEVDLVHSVGETTLQSEVCSILPQSEVLDPKHGGRFRYSRIEHPTILNNLVIATPADEAHVNRLCAGVSDLLHDCMAQAWPRS